MTTTVREEQILEARRRQYDLVPRIPTVRILPRDDEIRKGLIHPDGAIGFPATGSTEWPLDSWTQRRIHEGSVIVDGTPPADCCMSEEKTREAHNLYLAGRAWREAGHTGDFYALETAEHPGEIAHRVLEEPGIITNVRGYPLKRPIVVQERDARRAATATRATMAGPVPASGPVPPRAVRTGAVRAPEPGTHEYERIHHGTPPGRPAPRAAGADVPDEPPSE